MGKSLLEYVHGSFDTTLNNYCVMNVAIYKSYMHRLSPQHRGERGGGRLKGQICVCEKRVHLRSGKAQVYGADA